MIPGKTEADIDALVVADVLVACELIRLGYAPKALYRAWRAIPPMKMDAAVTQVRDAL